MKNLSIIIIAILFFLTSCEKTELIEPDSMTPTNEISRVIKSDPPKTHEGPEKKTDKDWGGKRTATPNEAQITRE